MEIAYACCVERTLLLVDVGCELHPMRFEHIACAAYRRTASVAVLSDLVACSCHDKRSACADVEGVFPVAASAYDVDGVVFAKVEMLSCFQESLTETEKFIHGDALHLQAHEQGCNFALVVFLANDVEHYLVCVFLRKRVALCETNEILFHGYVCLC